MGAANSVGEMATNAAHAAKTAPDNIRGVIEVMSPEAKEQFRAMLAARCRIVTWGLAEADGYDKLMAMMAPMYAREGVYKGKNMSREMLMVSPDGLRYFCIQFFDGGGEAALKEHNMEDGNEERRAALTQPVKDKGLMCDPVHFKYMDEMQLWGGRGLPHVPPHGVMVGKPVLKNLPGWPADWPSMEGAILKQDALVNAEGSFENVKKEEPKADAGDY